MKNISDAASGLNAQMHIYTGMTTKSHIHTLRRRKEKEEKPMTHGE